MRSTNRNDIFVARNQATAESREKLGHEILTFVHVNGLNGDIQEIGIELK